MAQSFILETAIFYVRRALIYDQSGDVTMVVDDQPSLFAQEKPRKALKDSGQRQACGCIMSKDIGQYNTCPHLCVYCYANHAPSTVRKNHQHHRDAHESII